jgi:hypothetical protein
MRIIIEYAKINMFTKLLLKSINQSVEFYEKSTICRVRVTIDFYKILYLLVSNFVSNCDNQ